MAIEPLGSMTAIQMQSTTKVQAPEPAVRNDAANKDVISADSAVPKMEDATAIVAKSAGSNAKQNENGQDAKKSNNEAIRQAVDNLNKNMNSTEAIFGIHDGTNRVTIKIIDRKTKEVIKELPPEKTLDMIEKVWEMAGILIDEKR